MIIGIIYINRTYNNLKVYDWNSLSNEKDNDEIVKRYLEYQKSEEAKKDRELNRLHMTIFLIGIICSVIYSFFLWTKWWEMSNGNLNLEFVKPIFCSALTAVFTGFYYKMYSKLLK